MDSQEDDHPSDADEHRGEDEDVPPPIIIRGSSDEHTQRKGGNPRGDRVELGLNGTVAEGSDGSGGKVGVTVSGNDETEVHKTAEDDLEIPEDTKNIPPGHLSVKLGVAGILSEPGLCEGLLVIGEPPGFLGEIRDNEMRDNGISDGHETL